MQHELMKKIRSFAKQKSVRKAWQRIVSGLTCIVVFCTTYALILPAITMEGNAFCGIEDHMHIEDCYSKENTMLLVCDPAHDHSAACYNTAGELNCGKADFVLHAHSSICYDDTGVLRCSLPQVTEHSGESGTYYIMEGTDTPLNHAHVHSDACYTVERGAQLCALTEGEAHVHTADCYGAEVVICGQEEWISHHHEDGCYGEAVVSCGREETAGHTHSDSCYSDPVQTCTLEETAGHTHNETCWSERTLVCQNVEGEEHTHGDVCYAEAALVCGQEEIAAHSHGENCFTKNLICTQAELETHEHVDGCYTKPLICTLPEGEGHTHTESCKQIPLVCTISEEVHTHTDACYEAVSTLSCGKLAVQEHIHTEACLQQKPMEELLVCEKEEHIHSVICYSNPDADIETQELWERAFVNLKLDGTNAENLLAVAKTQLGYQESSANYTVLDDGITMKGYTRYGAWTGTPYADWNNLFVDFCLHYAGISAKEFPWKTMTKTQTDAPNAGDLIFLKIENENYTGIVTKVSEGYVTAILGDYKNEVKSETFAVTDRDIQGYVTWEIGETSEPSTPLQEELADSLETSLMTVLMQTNESAAIPEAIATDGILPNVTISGQWSENGENYGAVYDPVTDTFKTQVRIEFNFDATNRPEADTVYTYTYPKGIVIPDDKLGTTDLLDKSNVKAGTYTFVKNEDGTYSVQIKFDQDYLTTHSIGPIDGFVQFGVSLGKDAVNDEGNIVLGGEDGNQLVIPGEEIHYPEDETESYDINVAKTGGYYNSETKRLEYTVEVTSEKGTPGDIDLKDIIVPPEGVTLSTPTIASIIKTEYARNEAVPDSPWEIQGSSTNLDVQPTINNGEFSLTLPKLERVEHDDPTVIECTKIGKYTITYYYEVTDVEVTNPSITNTVNVSSKDENKGQTVTDSDEYTTYIPISVDHTFQKTGRVDGDKILWTLTVNTNKVNIAGAELTDGMFSEMVENSMIITPSDGCTYVDDKITFSAIGDTGVNKNKYIITYKTPVKKGWNTQQVTNDAAFSPPDDEDDIEQNITVNVQGVQLNKSGQHDSANNKINWTITINEGRGDITGATLTDEMFVGLKAKEVTITMNDGVEASGYQINTDDSGNITSIVFQGEGEQKNTNKYTITYSTVIPGDSTSVTNNATLTPGDDVEGDKIGTSTQVDVVAPTLSKDHDYNEWYDDDQVTWTIMVNENGKNIAGARLEDTMFGSVTAVTVEHRDSWDPMQDGEYEVVYNEQNNISHILFKGIGETGVNTKIYKVTYTTIISKEWTSQYISNTAKLTVGSKETEVDRDFTISGSGSLGKTAGEIAVVEGKAVIPWTIEVKDIPSGGIPAGTTIVDDLTRNPWNDIATENHWITKEQAQSWSSNVILTWSNNITINTGYSVSFVGTDGKEYTLDKVAAEGSPAKYKGFIISFTEDLIPPDGINFFKFSYQSTTDGVDSIQNGTQFNNKVSSGDKVSGTQTQYHTLSAKKTDGNNQTQPSTTTNSDGTLTWKVVVTMDHQDRNVLEVLDELPDGVVMESVSVKVGNSNDVTLTMDEQGNLTGTVENGVYTVSGTYVHTSNDETGEKTNQVNLTFQSTDQQNQTPLPKGKDIVFTYHCRVEDVENTSSGSYPNKATVKVDDAPLPEVEQKQDWTKQEEVDDTQAVAKRGSFDSNNDILKYTVDINPTGKDIVPGTGSADLDYLTLTDILEHEKQVYAYPANYGEGVQVDIKAALIQGSVKLYKAKTVTSEDGKTTAELDENGNLVKDVPIVFTWTQEAVETQAWEKHKHIITAAIPDETPLILEYNYKVTTTAPESYVIYNGIAVNNTVTLQGESQGSTEDGLITEWVQDDASAGVGSQNSYTFYKVEEGNDGIVLPGAVFTLYLYQNDEWQLANRTFTTGTDGIVQIVYDATVYQYNTLYKLVETEAPKDYKLSQTEYYFYFGSSTEGVANNLPESLPAGTIDLSSTSETVYVRNEKNTPELTEVTVQKVWKQENADGSTSDYTPTGNERVTLQLYRKTTAGSGGSSGGTSGGAVSYIATCNNNETLSGEFSGVTNGDKVKISVAYTWQASSYNTMPRDWSGVRDGSGSYSSNGYVYDYTCWISSNSVTFHTGDNKGSISSITCTLLESGSTETTPEVVPTSEAYGDPVILTGSPWSCTFKDLPLSGVDENGNEVNYYYYVVETPMVNFTPSYSNNDGINTGTITVTNTKSFTPVYELPETGGAGTFMYTLSGLVLCGTAALGYNHKKRRRGDHAS